MPKHQLVVQYFSAVIVHMHKFISVFPMDTNMWVRLLVRRVVSVWNNSYLLFKLREIIGRCSNHSHAHTCAGTYLCRIGSIFWESCEVFSGMLKKKSKARKVSPCFIFLPSFVAPATKWFKRLQHRKTVKLLATGTIKKQNTIFKIHKSSFLLYISFSFLCINSLYVGLIRNSLSLAWNFKNLEFFNESHIKSFY